MPSIISAVFCLKPRARGQSALFDALAYLSPSGSFPSSSHHTIVGWTGELSGDSTLTHEERIAITDELRHTQGGHVEPVWLHDEPKDFSGPISFKDQNRWSRYGDHELYTLFHYKQNPPTDGRQERIWWDDYHRVNKAFADQICAIYKPGDIICVHDYHLCLLPAILRQHLPDACIGFFLHIPFPSSELMRCLSRRNEILEGMLGSNFIGFQSSDYCRHFSSCCKRILGYESSIVGIDTYGAHVVIDALPIGINTDVTERFAFENPKIEKVIQEAKNVYEGQKIIIGRDRLDSVRGITQKLQAFERLLRDYPEWRKKVVLIQVTSPTSFEGEKYDDANKTSTKVSELVSRINGLYGSISYSPVRHHNQYLSKEEYFALLRVADLGLITSVRDGMNTASLEYIVCQKGHYGPLILSEFSGTAGNLSSAIHINPWDIAGVASHIHRALKMPEGPKRSQFERLYAHVTSHTVQCWIEKFLERLHAAFVTYGRGASTPSLDNELLIAQYRASRKRLFMFDYDGTLTPIVKDPDLAVPSDNILRSLEKLSSDGKNAVWIISGRDQDFLSKWMGQIPALGLSAEHGCFVRHPNETEWENVTEKTDMSWKDDVMEVFQFFTDKTPGSFTERKQAALTWHYRRADPEYGKYQAHECRQFLESTIVKACDVEVIEGKANLEVRPRFVNKGVIAMRLVSECANDAGADKEANSGQPDFVLCLGDDFTDEDMFQALKASNLQSGAAFSCTVGASSKDTKADWHLLEPHNVLSTIEALNESVAEKNY